MTGTHGRDGAPNVCQGHSWCASMSCLIEPMNRIEVLPRASSSFHCLSQDIVALPRNHRLVASSTMSKHAKRGIRAHCLAAEDMPHPVGEPEQQVQEPSQVSRYCKRLESLTAHTVMNAHDELHMP